MGDEIRFLKALYPADIPADMRLLIWTLPDKTSHWCETIEDAARVALRASDARSNVYVGAGLGRSGLKQNERVKNADVLAIPGLWIDIDYRDGDSHRKQNLPSKEEAELLIAEIGKTLCAPTLVVHSGHGYQVWWLFRHVWTLDETNREDAAAIVKGWTYCVRDIAREHGWDVDATIDLARVLRVPGTFNYKGDPVPTSITSSAKQEQKRYTPDEFSSYAGYEVKHPSGNARQTPVRRNAAQQAAGTGGLTLDPSAEPPFDKWLAICDNNPTVLRTWHRERKDFKDTSPSAYDMALASFTVAVGWTDQEITNLLIACRRKHGDDLKLREDYYRRTIDRARSTVDMQRIEDGIDDPNASADEGIEALSRLFGVTIEKITKYLGDPPTYVMTLRMGAELRDITLGGIEAVLTQRTFRARIAAAVNLIVPRCPEAQWERRAQLILNVMEEQELGPESTPAGAARQWMSEYLNAHRPSEDEWEQAALAGRPFVHDAFICVGLRGVLFWLRNVMGERITSRELGRYMRMAGFEQYAQFIQLEGKKPTTRSVWRMRA